MAKRAVKSQKQSKSGAIRAYMADHPAEGPTEVSQALNKQGIKVSPAYVSTIKTASKASKNGHATNGGAANNGSAKPMPAEYLEQLIVTRRYVEQVGGVESAAVLVDSLRKLLAG